MKYKLVVDIQTKVLDLLHRNRDIDRVLKTFTYSLSSLPDPEYSWIPSLRKDGVIVVFVSSRNGFEKFRRDCDRANLHVHFRFEEFSVDKWTYSCFITECD